MIVVGPDKHSWLGARQRFADDRAVLAAVLDVWPNAQADGPSGAARAWWVPINEAFVMVAYVQFDDRGERHVRIRPRDGTLTAAA
jgi:hypothetical protein